MNEKQGWLNATFCLRGVTLPLRWSGASTERVPLYGTCYIRAERQRKSGAFAQKKTRRKRNGAAAAVVVVWEKGKERETEGRG